MSSRNAAIVPFQCNSEEIHWCFKVPAAAADDNIARHFVFFPGRSEINERGLELPAQRLSTP